MMTATTSFRYHVLIASFVIFCMVKAQAPTFEPTFSPSSAAPIPPSFLPTFGPTLKPSVAPITRTPTISYLPTSPTVAPTVTPSYSLKPTSPTAKPSAKPTGTPSSAAPSVNDNPQINSIIFIAVLVPIISCLCLIGIIRGVWIVFGISNPKGTPAEQANLVPSEDAADNL